MRGTLHICRSVSNSRYTAAWYAPVLGARGGRVLASRPLLWLGTVSYGLYLWQFLILDSVLPAPPSFVHPYAWYVLGGLAVTAIVAGLSYRLAPDASDGC